MSTDANRAKAARMRGEGRSLRDIARVFDVSAPTIKRWTEMHAEALAAGEAGAVEAQEAELASVAEVAEVPEVADVDDLPASAADESADAMAMTRRMLRNAQAAQKKAEQNGNHKLAQMHARDAGALVVLLARLEKTHKADSDTLHISRQEIAQAFETVRDKAALICSKPLLCSACGRELAATLAGIPVEDPEGGGR